MMKFYLIPFLAAFILFLVDTLIITVLNPIPDKPVKTVEHTCTVQPDKTKTEITEIKPEKFSITITTTCR